jgi:hypothetical protein
MIAYALFRKDNGVVLCATKYKCATEVVEKVLISQLQTELTSLPQGPYILRKDGIVH